MRNLKLLKSLQSSELQGPGSPQCLAVRADTGSLLIASHYSITEYDPRTGQVRCWWRIALVSSLCIEDGKMKSPNWIFKHVTKKRFMLSIKNLDYKLHVEVTVVSLIINFPPFSSAGGERGLVDSRGFPPRGWQRYSGWTAGPGWTRVGVFGHSWWRCRPLQPQHLPGSQCRNMKS